jgi:hypothetical protein
MPLQEIDFVIEVYCYKLPNFGNDEYPEPVIHECFYLFIPVGTTYTPWATPPDYQFKGKLKPGHGLGLDHPLKAYALRFVEDNY